MACEKFVSGSAIFTSAIDHMQTIAPNDQQCCQGTTWLDNIESVLICLKIDRFSYEKMDFSIECNTDSF